MEARKKVVQPSIQRQKVVVVGAGNVVWIVPEPL